MNKKQFYLAPEAELLLVKFEEDLLQGSITPTYSNQGTEESGYEVEEDL